MTHAKLSNEQTLQRSPHPPSPKKEGTERKTMSSNEADAIVQFQGLTGAPENQARFFLESANWDLEVRSPLARNGDD